MKQSSIPEIVFLLNTSNIATHFITKGQGVICFIKFRAKNINMDVQFGKTLFFWYAMTECWKCVKVYKKA